MTPSSRFSYKKLAQRTAVALATVAACAGASAALQPFTLNPTGAGLAGPAFNGDNILISDFSTVTFGGGGTTFTDSGFLSFSAIQNGGLTFGPTGLNTDYGLYIAFSGAGTTSGGDPATTAQTGTFTSLTYTLYGYNGTATFGFSGNTPTETASGEVALAHGSLMFGSVTSTPNGDGTFTPTANAKLSFIVDNAAFFQSPSPFYNLALTAFTNTSSEVEAFDGGFRIRQGGGSLNFAATPAVPEPETYALLLGGLAAVGFVARRRRT